MVELVRKPSTSIRWQESGAWVKKALVLREKDMQWKIALTTTVCVRIMHDLISILWSGAHLLTATSTSPSIHLLLEGKGSLPFSAHRGRAWARGAPEEPTPLGTTGACPLQGAHRRRRRREPVGPAEGVRVRYALLR